MSHVRNDERTRAWDRVLTNPGDLAARRVLADLLSEEDDCRGELLALGLQAKLSAPQRARLKALSMLELVQEPSDFALVWGYGHRCRT